ncbi:MAG: chemotaxis protein CheB [Candidatus Aminicenantes bacterium]|nr:chemotaxis protein CheB [Candidatus Aminicenantes bacterium]
MRASATRHAAKGTHYKAVVIGGSTGGSEALDVILAALPKDFALPILAVQHLHPSDDGSFACNLDRVTQLPVLEPHDKERIEQGRVYTAPANYHMLVERDGTIGLSVDARVNYSRPSIDVLFESAALTWGEALVAVILSGTNADGAKGMRAVKAAGGLTIAQDPASAKYPVMPQAAIEAEAVDEVLRAEEIGRLLAELGVREKP